MYNKMNEHYNNYCDYTDCAYCVQHICDRKKDIICQRKKDKEAIMNMINGYQENSGLIKNNGIK